MCVGTRNGTLGCTSNDVLIAEVQVTNGVTSCVAGTTVDIGLRVLLQTNAQSRYDVGVFVAKDGKPPELSTVDGGSANCAVFGIPTAPSPLENLNSNVCGDIVKGPTASVDLGTISLLCTPDQTGKLKVPTTITWEQNANGVCQAPPAAWVEATSPSKCSAGEGIEIPVAVVGQITITKETQPAASPGNFAFTATGAGPSAFSLSHGQQQVLLTGPLTSATTTVTVTEAALAGFDPTADIACTGADGGPAASVTIDEANRTVTARMNAAISRINCTFTNKVESRIRVVKSSVGGDDTFPFVIAQQDVPITTVGGKGDYTRAGLSAGIYAITEIVPAGWKLTNIACTDPTGGTTVNLPGKSARVDLAVGETVVCTFTDEKSAPPASGVINITKTTAGGDATFGFTAQVNGSQNFSLRTTGGVSPTKSFTGLAAGTYSVTELVPSGWVLAGITCTDPTGNSSGSGATATIDLAAGESVTCTFNNRANASVVIEKITEGGDATFGFVGPDPNNFSAATTFSIATVSGYGQDNTTYASIPPGSTVSITETVPAGWAFNGATCRDTVTNATVGTPLPNGRVFVVSAGQQVLCTFNNRRLAQLTIAEVSTPKSAQSFAYAVSGTGLANFSLADDGSGNNRRVFADLAPGGTYSVSQAAVAGWTTTSILCSDRLAVDPSSRTSVDLANRTVTPSLQPGEQLTCAFYNSQAANGSITIAKSANGGDGPFAFANSGGVGGSATNPAAFTIATASGAGSQQLTSLAAGTYTITETVPAGWLAPVAVQCAVLSGTNTTFTPLANGVTIALGTTGGVVDSARCTFDNTRAGSITIVEDATPDSTQSFSYTASGTGVPANFSLVNDGTAAPAERAVFSGLAPGAFRFIGSTPSGWELRSIDCAGGAAIVVPRPLGEAIVNLQAGENVTCTYRHRRLATITIVKSATGGVPGETFTFTGPSGLAGDYTAGQSRSATLTSGTYAVTEIVPDGWTLDNISCVGGALTFTGAAGGTDAFEPGDTTANIGVGAGETATCTFTNTKPPPPPAPGIINVVKRTTGGDGAFAFTTSVPGTPSFALRTRGGVSLTQSFTNLAAGTYTITEQVTAGWTLSSIGCVDPTGNTSVSGATATVAVASGETVTCTFNNSETASIVVDKVAQGGDATFSFGGTASFSIATATGVGRDATTFSSVIAGTPVTITETPPAGWVLTGASCRDTTTNAPLGSTIANGVQVTPAAGQRIGCTFTNTKLAELTIVEGSSPNSPQVFTYTTTGPGLANFPLADDGSGNNRKVFTGLVPGQAYSVAQGAVAGWVTTTVVCSDRADPVTGNRTPVDIAARTVAPNLQPGEKLVCVFLNTQVVAGTITVSKTTNGGNDTFAFANSNGSGGSATNPATFSIATTNNTGSRALTGLAPGTYTITETIPAGWLSPATVECSVLFGSSSTITPISNGATVVLGQTGAVVDSVACTFGNSKAARLTVVEDAVPDAAQSFAYTGQGPGLPATFALVNDGSPAPADRTTFEGLVAGTYAVGVTTPAGWRLASLGCVGTTNGSVDLAAGRVQGDLATGDDVTCTFRHAREGTITITKAAAAATAGDSFAFTGPAGLDGDYAAGQTKTLAVLPGTYSVAEIVPDGWTLSNIACTGGTVQYTGATTGATNGFEAGDNNANILIAAGEAVACTFTNAPSSSAIVVTKQSVGGVDIFAFTGVEDFQIDTRSRRVPTKVLTVAPGTHTVREIVPEGWRLTGLVCSGTSTVNLSTATATITVAAGERVSCTFTDEKLGRIEIIKAIRGETTTTFTFGAPTTLVPTGLFTLTPTVAEGSATRVFTNVPTGSYFITENGPPGSFRLLSIDCVDPTGDTRTNPADGGASIQLAPGESVTCTYANATLATITLGTISAFGQAQFGYSLTNFQTSNSATITTAPVTESLSGGRVTYGNLPPATYTITAQPAPAGWRFVYAQCTSSSGEQKWIISGLTITILLPDGETVNCYYVYAPLVGLPTDPFPIPVNSPLAVLLLALSLLAVGWLALQRR